MPSPLVGEAGTGHEAVNPVSTHRPDVVLMDLRMPDMGGIEATERICAATPLRRRIPPEGSHSGPTAHRVRIDR
jgi:CheY-like chemotaxis protein